MLSLGTAASDVSPVVRGASLYPSIADPLFFTFAGGEEYPNVDFVLSSEPLHSVAGRVELPFNGAGAMLVLTPPDQPALTVAMTLAAEDGSFRLEGVGPGQYELLASAPIRVYSNQAEAQVLGPGALFSRSLLEVGGSDLEGVSVSLDPGFRCSFILRQAKGTPPGVCPDEATLTISATEQWGSAVGGTAQITASRENTLDNLAPGRFIVSVSGLGGECHYVGNRVLDLRGGPPPSPLAVDIGAAGSIRGSLTGSGGASAYVVLLLPQQASQEMSQAVQIARPDADGRFGFSSLRPGRYRIGARLASGTTARWLADRSDMIDLEIVGGAPTELDLPAPAPMKP
jgi:hypothetical protein